MAYAVNFTNLVAYTDQISEEIVEQAVAETKISQYATVMAGNPAGIVAIPQLRNTLFAQTSSAGFPAGGTISIAQTSVTIDDMQVKTIYQGVDFRTYFTSYYITASGQIENLPFEKAIVDLMEKQIKLYIETSVFFGDGANNPYDPTGPGNVTGLITDTTAGNAGSTSVGGTIGYPIWPSGTTAGATNVNNVCWTAIAGATSNAVTQIQAIINGVAPAVWQHTDLTLYCSIPNYMTFIQAGVNANLFHYDFGYTSGVARPVSEQWFFFPGTNVKVVPFAGLSNSCRVLLGPAKYLIYAVGLNDEATDFAKLYYDEFNDEIKYMAKWRLGAKIIYPEYWVSNNLTTTNGSVQFQ